MQASPSTTTGHKNSFRREHQLRDTLSSLPLTKAHAANSTFVRREVPLGDIIPDVVYVSFSSRPSKSLWPRRWTHRHAHILWLLRRRKRLKAATIARWCYDTEARITPLLDDLESSGAIERVPTGTFQLTNEMRTVNAAIVAVETKLTRWKDALAQASSYLRFADESVVAMTKETTPRDDKRLSYFHSSGVGLCAVGPGEIEWLIEPQRSDDAGAEKEYLIGSAAHGNQTLWSAL